MNGKLITFEGCEGVGKSTQLRLLKEYLERTGQSAVFTREPGGTPIAEEIRSMLLYKNFEISPVVEAYLFATARADHVNRVILPALEQGKLVVCDRYVDSSLAYQGYARGLGEEYVASINAFALKECPPDLTLFLNIPPDRAFERKHGADRDDRMEQLGLPFHMRVYEGYLALMAKYPRICPVDCSGSKAQTSQKIWDILVSRGVVKGQ